MIHTGSVLLDTHIWAFAELIATSSLDVNSKWLPPSPLVSWGSAVTMVILLQCFLANTVSRNQGELCWAVCQLDLTVN